MSHTYEKRAEPRLAFDHPVIVTLLDDPPLMLEGRIENISCSGMRMILNRPVATDTAIRIDLNNTLLLGEVCYCWPIKEGHAVGIALEHSLRHLDSLQSLMKRLGLS